MHAKYLPHLLLGLAVTVLGSASASAQDENRAERKKFDDVFEEWKLVLRDLNTLMREFQLADDEKLEDIREKYVAKLEESRKLIIKLRDSGLAAYEKSPNGDSHLTQFLVNLARDDLENDRFENALLSAETLLNNGCDAISLYDIAGSAAFCTNRFDLAEKYLQQAETSGALVFGREYLPVVPQLKANWEQEQKIRSAEAAANLPRVKLQTSQGDVVLELFENEAPETVSNFIYLVEKGYYDGLTFHRVIPGFVAQGGCNQGDGMGGPGYTIYCECIKDGYRRHFAGALSMAKGTARHTGGSQFFLTFVPTYFLDGQHTVFGRIVEGMDVLPKLQRRDPDKPEQMTIVPERIIKAEVLQKRPDHQYVPNKVPNSE